MRTKNCEQNPSITKPDKRTKAKSTGFIVLYSLIVVGFLAIGPKLFSSTWVSSSDFHSCIEITSSFIAIIAAVACLMYYFGFKSRFYLICALGFFICGGEDFIHGLFSFTRFFTGMEADLSKFVPGTYVAGRSAFAIFIILATLLGDRSRPVESVRKETIFFSTIAVVIGCGMTALAIILPLPQFIYPEQLISRPVDFVSAVLFAIAFAAVLKKYIGERSIFSGFLLACILLNLGGQVYMSFSKRLFDAFFDTAHWANILSYCMPVLGISVQVLKEIRKSNNELSARRQAEEQLQEYREHLEELVEKRTSELEIINKELERESNVRKQTMEDLEHENTVRKQAEESTRRAYEELEKINKELKGTQAQLVQNEKLASIGQLAAGVAHEMNTPVGFVASNFQTLESYVGKLRDLLEMYEQLGKAIETCGQKQLLSSTSAIKQSREDMQIDFILEDIKGLFNDSKEGLSRVTTIIQNLRDFSRIDQVGSFDEFTINDGIKATLVVAKNEVKYDTEVKLQLSEVPKIFCHASQLNQVFLNILINASQAIKTQQRKEKGAIIIKTYATEEHVVCEIIDDGPGIAPENLSKILDPFFTTKPAGKGTGLGLSVSHDIIVNKHKGQLLVDSAVGEGTKFTIKLPIHRESIADGEGIENYERQESVICE